MFVLLSFFFMLTGYVELTRHVSGSGKLLELLVGISLPITSFAAELVFVFILERSYLQKVRAAHC